MSLQLAAQHLSDHGRGPDDTLVHMSRNEVKSLNDLAMAHGGQLTINPQTGLPEAGFLSAILPMVAGAALNVALPGSGMLVPALVGGASMLLNPKAGLMGGLMAGMGAYGGMNLGSALAESGMQQAGAEELAKSQAGISNVVGNAGTQGLPAGVSADQYAKNVLAQTQPYVDARTAAQTAFDTGSFTDRLGTMGQGAKTLASPGGFSNLYQNLGNSPMSRLGTVAALASPALTQQAEQPPAPVADKDMGQRYTYNPGVAKPIPAPDVPTYEDMMTKQGNFGRQQTYFPDARYEKISAEQAKNIYGFAGGGPVEQMSNNNAIGANTGFPQAYLHNNAYATPYQTPISQNVLTGAGDTAVDPYTGEQKMAGGGISGSGHLDLNIPLDFGNGSSGGFGGAGANGYSAVGSGGGSQTGFTGQNNTGSNALGTTPFDFLNAANTNPSSNGVVSAPETNKPIESGHFGTNAFSGAFEGVNGLSSLLAGNSTRTTPTWPHSLASSSAVFMSPHTWSTSAPLYLPSSSAATMCSWPRRLAQCSAE